MGRKKKDMKKSPHSHHEQKAGVSEQELIETFEQVFREDYPNPERIGCLSQELLRQAPSSPTSAPEVVLDHIAKCAICPQEYDQLRRKAKVSPLLKPPESYAYVVVAASEVTAG